MTKELISRNAAAYKGHLRYFTGEPCLHGHICERIVSNNQCLECAKIYAREQYAANPEKFRARSREWSRDNPDKVKIRNKKYKSENAERLRPIAIARTRKWIDEHREQANKQRRDRRARVRNAPGSHTLEQISKLLETQNWKCAGPKCNKSLRKRRHLDHKTALVCGGSNYIDNLQWLCPTCNMRKNRKDAIEFARENGLLL
ncbi:MAG: HNH endonuclease signature motif containing protein [Beijerinckiaceae bacterium]|nr:HNH endonuclease signature motif containing protein [Beijerinckiaceae bacterium]